MVPDCVLPAVVYKLSYRELRFLVFVLTEKFRQKNRGVCRTFILKPFWWPEKIWFHHPFSVDKSVKYHKRREILLKIVKHYTSHQGKSELLKVIKNKPFDPPDVVSGKNAKEMKNRGKQHSPSVTSKKHQLYFSKKRPKNFKLPHSSSRKAPTKAQKRDRTPQNSDTPTKTTVETQISAQEPALNYSPAEKPSPEMVEDPLDYYALDSRKVQNPPAKILIEVQESRYGQKNKKFEGSQGQSTKESINGQNREKERSEKFQGLLEKEKTAAQNSKKSRRISLKETELMQLMLFPKIELCDIIKQGPQLKQVKETFLQKLNLISNDISKINSLKYRKKLRASSSALNDSLPLTFPSFSKQKDDSSSSKAFLSSSKIDTLLNVSNGIFSNESPIGKNPQSDSPSSEPSSSSSPNVSSPTSPSDLNSLKFRRKLRLSTSSKICSNSSDSDIMNDGISELCDCSSSSSLAAPLVILSSPSSPSPTHNSSLISSSIALSTEFNPSVILVDTALKAQKITKSRKRTSSELLMGINESSKKKKKKLQEILDEINNEKEPRTRRASLRLMDNKSDKKTSQTKSKVRRTSVKLVGDRQTDRKISLMDQPNLLKDQSNKECETTNDYNIQRRKDSTGTDRSSESLLEKQFKIRILSVRLENDNIHMKEGQRALLRKENSSTESVQLVKPTNVKKKIGAKETRKISNEESHKTLRTEIYQHERATKEESLVKTTGLKVYNMTQTSLQKSHNSVGQKIKNRTKKKSTVPKVNLKNGNSQKNSPWVTQKVLSQVEIKAKKKPTARKKVLESINDIDEKTSRKKKSGSALIKDTTGLEIKKSGNKTKLTPESNSKSGITVKKGKKAKKEVRPDATKTTISSGGETDSKDSNLGTSDSSSFLESPSISNESKNIKHKRHNSTSVLQFHKTLPPDDRPNKDKPTSVPQIPNSLQAKVGASLASLVHDNKLKKKIRHKTGDGFISEFDSRKTASEDTIRENEPTSSPLVSNSSQMKTKKVRVSKSTGNKNLGTVTYPIEPFPMIRFFKLKPKSSTKNKSAKKDPAGAVMVQKSSPKKAICKTTLQDTIKIKQYFAMRNSIMNFLKTQKKSGLHQSYSESSSDDSDPEFQPAKKYEPKIPIVLIDNFTKNTTSNLELNKTSTSLNETDRQTMKETSKCIQHTPVIATTPVVVLTNENLVENFNLRTAKPEQTPVDSSTTKNTKESSNLPADPTETPPVLVPKSMKTKIIGKETRVNSSNASVTKNSSETPNLSVDTTKTLPVLVPKSMKTKVIGKETPVDFSNASATKNSSETPNLSLDTTKTLSVSVPGSMKTKILDKETPVDASNASATKNTSATQNFSMDTTETPSVPVEKAVKVRRALTAEEKLKRLQKIKKRQKKIKKRQKKIIKIKWLSPKARAQLTKFSK